MSKIVQIAFDVLDDIYEGLMNGTLSNFGSVVRDSKGIVAHLKQADLPLQEVKEGAKALVKNKKLMIVGVRFFWLQELLPVVLQSQIL